MNKCSMCLLALGAAAAAALLFGNAVASASCPQVGFTIVEPHPSAATRAVRVDTGQTIFVRRTPITRTRDIVQIKLAADDNDDASLLIRFTPAAAQRLHDTTTNHSGLRIAFMADDDVLLDVVWQGPYGMDTDGTRVSLRHGMQRARKLVNALRGCTGS